MFRIVPTLTCLAALAAGPVAQASWVCLSQDHSYSYEARGETRGEASQAAVLNCQRTSDAPHECYLHRCAGERTALKRDAGTRLTYRQIRALEDALDRQHCSATPGCYLGSRAYDDYFGGRR